MVQNHKRLMSFSADTYQESSAILKRYDFNYFQYLTVYDDGSYSILSNQGEYLEFAFDYARLNNCQAIFSHINQKEILSKTSYYFLWDFNLPSNALNIARSWNVNSGLTFVERYPNYYNMIAFAAPISHVNPVDTYLNNINQLQAFIQNFKHDKKDLINAAQKIRIALPPTQQDTNLHKMLLCDKSQVQKMPVFWKDKVFHLTPQERICLKYLSQGQSIKSIANNMGLSARTIETYLQRIKNRMGIVSKNDLLLMYRIHDPS